MIPYVTNGERKSPWGHLLGRRSPYPSAQNVPLRHQLGSALGLVVSLPFRGDRFFCLPLLWRVYEKRGSKNKQDHRTKPELAADAVQKWFLTMRTLDYFVVE